MNRQAYSKLIKKYATERRKTDAPHDTFIPKRKTDEKPQEEKVIVQEPRKHAPLIALTHDNFKHITLDRVIPGTYYAKADNRYTSQPVKFGTLIIHGYTVIQRKINEYNKIHHTAIPGIENIPYHIEHKNIIPFNSHTPQYQTFNLLYFKARNCSAQEVKTFEADNDVDHSEVIFVENRESKLFKTAYRKMIIRLAQLNKK